MKRLFSFLACSLVLFSACATRPKAPLHHALLILSHYRKIPKKPIRMASEQVNVYALDLLKRNNRISECRNYIQWVFNHLNSGDRWGISGTVYDYRVSRSGEEVSLRDYEAADSQAATFILLVREYFRRTQFRMMIEANQEKMRDIAYLFAYLQDGDGLTRVRPDSQKKLLRNNCLVYAAAGAFIELSREFHWDLGSFYKEVRAGVGNGIIESLFIPVTGEFLVGIDAGRNLPPDWDVADPDSFSQLFPVLYLDRLSMEKKIQLWHRFREHHINAFPSADFHGIVVQEVRGRMEKRQ